jgi:4-amino-4-deoxy-L-arabinose transferase-like glycosyltransferase
VRAPGRAQLPLLLIGLGLVGILGRDYYTPDEPREASLVVAMSQQAHKALPELAGRPFAEKPPLLYWLGGASVAAFGASPAAARLPNLLYLLVTGLATAALAGHAAGRAAGFAAGVVATTALQLHQILIWLATDAPLLAGVAVALLGAYRGLVATAPRARWHGYLLLHVGLAAAFFAKGFAGWMVPVFAYLTVIVLERRWRELWHWELWVGLPVVVLPLAVWVACVARLPGGVESLRVLFWYNLVGRAVALDTPAEFAYATGHLNSAGKYLVEMPLYLLPWTLLAVPALRRGWRRRTAGGAEATAWRLALGAIVPATALLSVAATARGVYFGPPALGFAMLIGLYVGGAAAALDRFERACWRGTAILVAALALGLGALGVIAACAPAWSDAVTLTIGAVGAAGAAFAAWLALGAGVNAAAGMPRLAVAATLALTVAAAPLVYQLNRWLSLATVAERIGAALDARPLVVLDPDETTLAMIELYLPRGGARTIVLPDEPAGVNRAATALAAAGVDGRVLWAVPGRAHWNLQAWSRFLGYTGGALPAPAAVVPPAELGPVRVALLLTRPGGRTYALLAPASAATQAP